MPCSATNRFVILFWMLSGFINIQSHAQSKFQAGPYLGNGVRLLTGNDKADIGFGYRAGIITRIPFSEQFSVAPTFTYTQKGYNKLGFIILEEDEYYRQKLNYLDICVPVKFQVSVFTFQVGLQAGFLLDGELRYKTYEGERQTYNIKKDLNSLDLGLIAGAGFQFLNGVGLELLINPGFSNIYDSEPPIYFDSYDQDFFGEEFDGKNMLATINIFYLFGYRDKSSE